MARLDIEAPDSALIGLRDEVVVECTTDTLTLKILVRVEAVDMTIRFQFDEADDFFFTTRQVGLLFIQPRTPRDIVGRRRSPGFELRSGMVGRFDRVDTIMKEIRDLVRVARLIVADMHEGLITISPESCHHQQKALELLISPA